MLNATTTNYSYLLDIKAWYSIDHCRVLIYICWPLKIWTNIYILQSKVSFIVCNRLISGNHYTIIWCNCNNYTLFISWLIMFGTLELYGILTWSICQNCFFCLGERGRGPSLSLEMRLQLHGNDFLFHNIAKVLQHHCICCQQTCCRQTCCQ